MKNTLKTIPKYSAFATYRIPNGANFYSIAQKGKVEEITPISNFNNGFLVAPFLKEKPTLFIQSEKEVKNDFIEMDFQLNANTKKSISKEEYIDYCTKALELLANKTISKIVLSRIKNLNKPNHFNPKILFKSLCSMYPNAFVYMCYTPQYGFWIGATPETLLRPDGYDYTTMALAGTKPSDSLLEWGEKEQLEQNIVEQHIEKNLNKAHLTFQKKGPATVKAGTVEHLLSTYRFSLPKDQILSLAESLHPTPAVAGTPTTLCTKWIQNIEPHQRELYCGYLGPINNAEVQLFVNLRSMQVFSNTLHLYVGGGILEQSDLLQEWDETNWKAQTLERAFQQ